MSDASIPPVLIVGAGMAGLACALELQKRGVSCEILEASDAAGGRVRSDEVDGFMLDRGFQVWLEAYPECLRLFDAEDLQAGSFGSGAYLYDGKTCRLFADPFRHPKHSGSALMHPVGSIGDKVKLQQLRLRLSKMNEDELFASESLPTHEALKIYGFSPEFVDGFLAPFFRGIFLENHLNSSRRMFDFVLSMFGQGRALLPAGGMKALPEQLLAGLKPGTVKLNQSVASVSKNTVRLSDGQERDAAAVILAVEDPAMLLGHTAEMSGEWNEVTCLYFACDKAPVEGPWLLLNGSGEGVVNQIALPSQVAKGYAPEGQELISVSINGLPELEGEALAAAVQKELEGWFGEEIEGWRFLREYRIPEALPKFEEEELPGLGYRQEEGVWICGDHQRHPSLQGALASGRLCAKAYASIGG